MKQITLRPETVNALSGLLSVDSLENYIELLEDIMDDYLDDDFSNDELYGVFDKLKSIRQFSGILEEILKTIKDE